jgi:Family of unknown function (DUF6452)
MKKISAFIILLLLIIVASCEKDDICAEATPTTPKLILRFYDFASQDDTKRVPGLGITSLDENNNLLVISGINGITTDSISLPLRTDTDFTKFTFYKDYAVDDNGTSDFPDDDIISGNPDIVNINYEREDVYVSRACGFKTNFNNITVTVEDDGDNWIINSEIINSTVENETTAHVKIFH